MSLKFHGLLLLLLATPLCASPRSSASYSITTDVLDGGGKRSTSAAYTNDDSVGESVETSTTVSANDTLKQGYMGQLYEVTGLQITAASTTLNEGMTLQLAASEVLDDTTLLAIPSGVSWSVVNGPLASVNTSGLVTAAKVNQDTAASAQGSYQGHTGVLNLTVINVANDFLALDGTLYSVREETGQVSIPVIRTGSSDGAVTVSLSTSSVGGTAVAGIDYTAITHQTVMFGDGETHKSVPIMILPNNATNQPNKTFSVSLDTPGSGVTLESPTTAQVRIITLGDNTAPKAPTITTPTSNATVGVNTGASLTIAGAATDNKGIGSVQISLNGGAFIQAAMVPAGTGASYSLPVVPRTGSNTLAVVSLDTRGNVSPTTSRLFTVPRPLVVNLSGPASSGSVTPGFAPISYRAVGKSFSVAALPKATPAPGFVFNGWSVNDATGTGITPAKQELPALTFTFQEGMVLTASFISNPFAAVAGSYNGLVHADPIVPAPGVTVPSTGTEGLFTGTVASTGAFSGKLTLDGLVLNTAGVFDNLGRARFSTARALTLDLPRPGKSMLSLALQLDLTPPPGGTEQLSGTVTQNYRSAVLASSILKADRAHYNGTTVIVPDAYLTVAGTKKNNGSFTSFLTPHPLPSQPSGFAITDYPQGDGFATVTATTAGMVSVAGTLADGTPVTAAAPLSKANSWPFFAQLYNKGGFISGQMGLNSSDHDSDLSSTGVQWARPFITGQYYPFGWPEVLQMKMYGAKYAATATVSTLKGPGGTALPGTDADGNAVLAFSNGKLSPPFIRSLNLSTNVAIPDGVKKLDATDTSFTLGITRASGKFSGTFLHTDHTRPVFQGLIYQKGAYAGGHGFFLTTTPKVKDGTGQSGAATLEAQGP